MLESDMAYRFVNHEWCSNIWFDTNIFLINFYQMFLYTQILNIVIWIDFIRDVNGEPFIVSSFYSICK